MVVIIQFFILLLFVPNAVLAFQYTPPLTSRKSTFSSSDSKIASVAVNAAELDRSLGLSPEERTVVNVHRVCSPSVVYVTSVLTPMGARSITRRRQRHKKEGDGDVKQEKQQKLPRGTSLGSGSGFTIDSAGYLLTNYHVIQRAYEANQAMIQYKTFWSSLARNTTSQIQDSRLVDFVMKKNVEGLINTTFSGISGVDITGDSSSINELPAQVFVRFGTNGDNSNGLALYHQCEIVDVVKELDIAILKMCNPLPSMKPLPFGSSSDLLVGQSLLAIGNPFGLDRTITSGLVSALGRSVTGVAGNEIKNCIQTDCAINPGNSGGPLLTLKGEVVGVNTMIITTSGSSAGIGFAVPSDNVKVCSDRIVELDKERQLRKLQRKGRGWLGIEVATSSLEISLRERLPGGLKSKADEAFPGAFITAIVPDSPIVNNEDDCKVSTTSITSGSIHLGDRIINVGGCNISDGQDFVNEMKRRVEGEQLSLTIETVDGEKKVVYVTLGRFPL